VANRLAADTNVGNRAQLFQVAEAGFFVRYEKIMLSTVRCAEIDQLVNVVFNTVTEQLKVHWFKL
jgi:hypothetical protein